MPVMDANKVTVISLADSTYAHSFNEDEMIHKEEFKKVIELIDRQIEKSKQAKNVNEKYLANYYNTISVFGERGTGKTSFLHSVINHLDEKKKKEVEIIGIIDPTIIEEKEHVFVLVISLINDIVQKKLNAADCNKNTKSPQQRSQWQKQLLKMAKGLPTLEKIGESKQTPRWQSHEFIMEEGLDIVHSAFQLESEFRKLVKLALEIIGKSVFVLMLDDIDVDLCKGWDVLEMLRKYLTTPQIITILSGNLKLYSLNVRKHQWEQLDGIGDKETAPDYFHKIVNELEGQYLIKVLKSENRIHLRTILESIEVFGAQYMIKKDNENSVNILDMYKKFFTNHGITGASSLNVFISYMLRLSVRSQIQFLLNSNSDNTGLNSVEAFISRLYAANIDVTQTVNNPQMLEHIIQGYIESQESSPDLYLLMPNYPNEDLNACLTAFTILFTEAVSRSNFLIFDYLIRIGYVRNLILGLNSYVITREDFYKHVGLKQMMSLKNNVGLSIGICDSNEWQQQSHIRLLGFSVKSKQNTIKSQGRIDYELKHNSNLSQRVIAYLPVSIIKYTNKKENRVYYSFYNLLAVVAEILKIQKGDNQKEMVRTLLMNLCQLRTYPVWKDAGDFQAKYQEEYADAESNDEDDLFIDRGKDKSLDTLVNDLVKWSKQYNESIPPYLLGRIATRMYYPLQKVSGRNLGEKMHRMVIAFLNACLIEECFEYYSTTANHDVVDRLNRSNAVTKDTVFLNNLSLVHRSGALDCIKLTRWMMRCPLIHAFIQPDLSIGDEFITNYNFLLDAMAFGNDQPYNVFYVLSKVFVMGQKPVFSASAENIEDTIDVLLQNNYKIERITSEEIPIDQVITDLYGRQIFDRKPTAKQIIAFRKYFKNNKL